ncbi:MAG: helix-turn-helix transcriptional regulator [Lachnospiraceae bacterium]|nr:helix-turn-helix transcriptional regulator [Lachnospiraceae bacterium]
MQYSLKELRARKGWTQRETAQKLGVSEQTYNAWKKDVSGVAVSKVNALAIDSEWDMKSLEDAVDIMLNPDEMFEDGENYVELIQEWTLDDHGDVPLFHYEEKSYEVSWYILGMMPNIMRRLKKSETDTQIQTRRFRHTDSGTSVVD